MDFHIRLHPCTAFQKCGLDRRISYYLSALYKGSNPKVAIFFVACLPVFFLTITGSITASAIIVIPLLTAFLGSLNINIGKDNNKNTTTATTTTTPQHSNKNNRLEQKNSNNYTEASFLALGQAATAGAMVLLISTAPNLIAKATVEKFVSGETISFTDWLIVGSPHAVIGLLVSWIVIFSIIKPGITSLPVAREQFKVSLKRMGDLGMEEKILLTVLVFALFLWVTPSVLKSVYHNETVYDAKSSGIFSRLIDSITNNIPESIPALVIILSVGFVRTRRSTQLLSWEEMTKAADWNVVLLFGGGLGLGLGIENSGLVEWMGAEISSNLVSDFTPWTLFAISSIMGFILSYSVSKTASAIIACPIATALAFDAGLNPILPIIAAALASSISSAIPSSTPPMAIIYSSKTVRIASMIKTGMISDLIRLGILIFLGLILIGIVFR